MNKEFAHSFFPFVASFASSSERAPSFILDAWNFIFPDACDLKHPPNLPLNMQRPCLAMAAVLGAYIGLREIKKSNEKHDDLLIAAINNFWSMSYICFGCMNIVALVHHCIFPSNFSWFLDCIFTGVSSLNLVTLSVLLWSLYGLEYYGEKLERLNDSTDRFVKIINGATKIIAAIMIHTTMTILGGDDDEMIVSTKAVSSAVELFYLVPLQMAVFVLFPITLIGAVVRNEIVSRRGPLITLLGGALVVAAALLGESICQFIVDNTPWVNDSSLLYDCYHLPTIFFLGCDVSFYGLGLWVKDLVRLKEL